MKPTVPQVLPAVEAFYTMPGNGTGGHLHIVLEDENVDDSHVQWCLDQAELQGDHMAAELAKVLLRMSKTQRLKLADLHGYPRDSIFGRTDSSEFWDAMKAIPPAP